MANKNHELDDPIINAAMNEFLEKGYEKSSMRKIAANAGVTVGAIYTRYSTKDSLFYSLAEPLLKKIEEAFSGLKEVYYNGGNIDFEVMSESIEMENKAILHLLFDEYDRAVLLLCRSRGSSLENSFDLILKRKTEETVSFFRMCNLPHPDEEVLRVILKSQFHMYYQIINEGYGLEDAIGIMNAVMIYHKSGWMALLSSCKKED